MNALRRIAQIARLPIISIIFATFQVAGAQGLPTDAADLLNLAGRNQDSLLRDLGPMFKAIGAVGRVYVHSECLGGSEDVLFFPRIDVNSEAKGKMGAAAIQDILAKNKDVRVSERQPGVIGIWISDIHNDLLTTRIRMLRLKPRQRYNYQDAIAAILATTEVQTKMREFRMEAMPEFASYPIVAPDPKLPHLAASMSDLTVDEALDQVARTFTGFVIYKECTDRKSARLFSILMLEM